MPPDPFGNSLIRFCDSIRVSHSERMDLTNLIQEKKMSKFEVICMEYSSECHENQFFGKSDQENRMLKLKLFLSIFFEFFFLFLSQCASC